MLAAASASDCASGQAPTPISADKPVCNVIVDITHPIRRPVGASSIDAQSLHGKRRTAPT